MDNRLKVATDASIDRWNKRTGLAAVTENGHCLLVPIDQALTTSQAEYLALRYAQKVFGGNQQRLLLYTDSQDAERTITSGKAITFPPGVKIPHSQFDLAEVQWVRGHNGHPLNTAADRAARVARQYTVRNAENTRKALHKALAHLPEKGGKRNITTCGVPSVWSPSVSAS